MLAGLTGLISGDRSVEPGAVERAAVSASVSVAVAVDASATVIEAVQPRVSVRPAFAANEMAPTQADRCTPREAGIDGRWLV